MKNKKNRTTHARNTENKSAASQLTQKQFAWIRSQAKRREKKWTKIPKKNETRKITSKWESREKKKW